jgi:hypothetical protein
MSKLWSDALEKFLQHLTQDGNNGSSYFFVDIHVSANAAQHVENASNSKMVQYNAVWNQYRSTTRPQDPSRYRQINHSRQDQPQIYAFGINYDAAIKYPVDPNNRSYKPSRARWISHYVKWSTDDRKSNEGDNDDIPARSEMDEKRVFTAISDLLPKAREHNTGIKTFYLQVEWT